jgi:hypothetical protein
MLTLADIAAKLERLLEGECVVSRALNDDTAK